jgi:hypothetical protein
MKFDNLVEQVINERVNKFDIAWQIVRARAKKIKDPKQKIDFVLDFLNEHPNRNNFGRILNFFKMTKIAYKDPSIVALFDDAIDYITTNQDQYNSTEDNVILLRDVPKEDLELVYNDLKKRKYGFQFKQVPVAHTGFMKNLEDELLKRK